jgi:L-fucose mutarotase
MLKENAMLKGPLLHPQIAAALARSGHGSKILIADGNYPHGTKRGPNAEVVYLNLAPGTVSVPEVLKTLLAVVPIEAAEIMDTVKTGPYGMKEDPVIWDEFRKILQPAAPEVELTKIERFRFYEATCSPDVCLTVATGDQHIYANIMLTIGVVR